MQQEEINIMQRILEDLYLGNLTVSGQTFRRGTKYARALARVAETEETLSQKLAPEYDRYLYKIRHLVENAFLWLKRWRGIATRYAKNTSSFLSAVHIRCIAIWLAVLA